MTGRSLRDISVIISTCRLEDHVRNLVGALLRQECVSSFEILLIDNSCSAQLERDVSEFASSSETPLRYIAEPRPGLHNVRHRGAIEAAGDNLVFIDDDVVVSEGWLHGISMVLADPDVAMVGGRVLLRFETSPPVWVAGFRNLLSEFDKGSGSREMTKDETPIGCNLAVRRDTLLSVGGFNPDAFADQRLLRLRGDGEVGLARKIREKGLSIWYEPAALVEHLVPEKRLSADYVRWRSMIGGIEQAYASYRYYPRTMPVLLYRALRALKRANSFERLAGPDPFEGPESVRHLIQYLRNKSCARHHMRQFLSRSLRQWTLRESYLPEKTTTTGS